jgi:hypothetical protein
VYRHPNWCCCRCGKVRPHEWAPHRRSCPCLISFFHTQMTSSFRRVLPKRRTDTPKLSPRNRFYQSLFRPKTFRTNFYRHNSDKFLSTNLGQNFSRHFHFALKLSGNFQFCINLSDKYGSMISRCRKSLKRPQIQSLNLP